MIHRTALAHPQWIQHPAKAFYWCWEGWFKLINYLQLVQRQFNVGPKAEITKAGFPLLCTSISRRTAEIALYFPFWFPWRNLCLWPFYTHYWDITSLLQLKVHISLHCPARSAGKAPQWATQSSWAMDGWERDGHVQGQKSLGSRLVSAVAGHVEVRLAC